MFPAQRIEISVDDGEFTRHRARTVVVGNVGFLQAGHAAAARRRDRRRPARRRDPAPAQLLLLDPAGLAGAAQAQAHRRAGRPQGRRHGRRPRLRRHARASSTATRSAPAASCGWSACTAGCWSGSPASPSRGEFACRVVPDSGRVVSGSGRFVSRSGCVLHARTRRRPQRVRAAPRATRSRPLGTRARPSSRRSRSSQPHVGPPGGARRRSRCSGEVWNSSPSYSTTIRARGYAEVEPVAACPRR